MTCYTKHIILYLIAAVMLLAPSCGKVHEADTAVKVSFSVALPQQIATRAISDGRGAVDLHFRVYKVTADGVEHLPGLDQDIPDAFVNLKAGITTSLVKGYTYDFVFWAQNPDAGTAYDLSTLDGNTPYVSVDYSAMANSDDSYDAFYVTETGYRVSEGASLSVVLKRPFAQVNFGSSSDDWLDAVTAGVTIDRTAMKYKGAYTRLYPITGEVSDPVDVTFGMTSMPSEALLVEDAAYTWLSMDYILVPAGKSLTDVSLELYSGGYYVNTLSVPNVPVQRNYRTNILGRLITTETRIEIVIDPVFVDDYNVMY